MLYRSSTILLASSLLYPMHSFSADVSACDLLDAKGAAEILGSPITSPPPKTHKDPVTPNAPYENSTCAFASFVAGRNQYVRLDLQVFKSTSAAKKDMDADLDVNDKNIRITKESGVGDSAYYSVTISDNRGIYVFRKSNRIVVMEAGGSGFKMTPTYRAALRKAAILAAGKL